MSSSPASPSAGHRLVTVVIPTYGRPRQIRDCLTALTAQTLGRGSFEVVVVDDGSPQPLGSLADDFAGRLDLRVVRQDNAGPSAARNRGVEEATTEMVAFTDDDCLPDPDWLAVLTAAEGGRPGSLVGGSTRNGLPENLFSEASQWIVDMVYDHFNHDPDAAYFFTSNNMLCSKRRYLEVGGFDTGFTHAGAEDRDFCDRWRARGWPLILRPDARIEHRHRQDFSGFFGMYFRYGRGACLYRARRLARATGTMREELGFHTSLPAKVWNGLNRYPGGWRRAQLCGALAVWQVANAAGFAAESLALRRRPARGR